MRLYKSLLIVVTILDAIYCNGQIPKLEWAFTIPEKISIYSSTFHNGRTKFDSFEKGYKHGFLDPCGRLIIKPIFDDAYDFNEGVATVKLEGKWALIDTLGRLITNFKYDEGSPFGRSYHGFAIMKIKDKYFGVDKQGQEVAYDVLHEKFSKYHTEYDSELGGFSESKFSLFDYKWKYGLKDNHGNGNVLVKAQYDRIGDFKNGFAFFEKRGRYGYFDEKGGIVIPPIYKYATDFSEGFACVKTKDEKYCLIDGKGQVVIDESSGWRFHTSFNEGLALVQEIVTGKKGFVFNPFMDVGALAQLKESYTQPSNLTSRLDSTYLSIWELGGQLHLFKEEYDSAYIAFSNALQIAPMSADNFHGRGKAQFELDRYPEAISDFTMAIALKPNESEFYISRALAKGKQNDIQGLMADCKKAVDIKKDIPFAYYLMGVCNQINEQYNEALNNYQQVLRYDPENEQAKERLQKVSELIEERNNQQEYQRKVALSNAITTLSTTANTLSSTQVSSTSNSSFQQNNNPDCYSLQMEYERQRNSCRNEIVRLTKKRTNDVIYGGSAIGKEYASTPTPALNVSILKSIQAYQDLMRSIRQRAANNGCTIQKAEEETWRLQ